MTNRWRWAIGLWLSTVPLACGASSDESGSTRTTSESCDAGRCGSAQAGGDDSAKGAPNVDAGPVPCPAGVGRRDISTTHALLAAPSSAPPPDPARPAAPDPAAPATPVALPDSCGDGRVSGTEQCDDGNTVSGDGCDALCNPEMDFSCPMPGQPCVFAAVCGDGLLADAEACDDGNVTAGDGCAADCSLEPGYACPVPGQACQSVCGDFFLVGAEQCEDGNATSGDGCSAQCRIEPGFVCPLQSLAQMMPPAGGAVAPASPDTAAEPVPPCWPAVCGNGLVENGEACDDGNVESGDGCTPDCALDPECTDASCTTVCGDGLQVPEAGEECDDGNLSPFDGCDASCHVEPGYVCMGGDLPQTPLPVEGTPAGTSQCTPLCGDGVAVGSEACDDGSNNGAGYGNCAADCELGPRCGDGVFDGDFEQCDNGLNNDRYAETEGACGPGCILPASCGDGVVQPTFGEQCDLGTTSNNGAYGGCNADCTLGPRCGDGVVQEIEQCDDGNVTEGDGCNRFCSLEPTVDGQPVPTGPEPTPEPNTDVFVPDGPAAAGSGPEPTAPALDPCR